MLKYSYKVELKRAENERLGLFLDLRKTQDKEQVKRKIEMKEKQIAWLKKNEYKHMEPVIE